MARVTGPGIDPSASYDAIPLVGEGFFSLRRVTRSDDPLEGSMSVKISHEVLRKIGRHKMPCETLAGAVERLLLLSIAKPSRS